LTYQQALVSARKEYMPVSVDKKQAKFDTMKTRVKNTRMNDTDKKMKVKLRTLKAELAELQDDEEELEELESLTPEERVDLKAIKRKIASTIKKIQSLESEPVEQSTDPNDDIPSEARGLQIVGQVKLKKKSVDTPIKGGAYGLSVMPSRISGSGRSLYGGASII
jgi:DNA repair exonuclease SbcCD ATPase subunit